MVLFLWSAIVASRLILISLSLIRYPDKIPPEKITPGKISLNAVEREPVETRVLNPNASYKPKQRSYRKTNLKKKFWCQIVLAPKCPAPKCPAPKRRRRIGGAETAAPKRTRPQRGISERKDRLRNMHGSTSRFSLEGWIWAWYGITE